MATFNKSRTLLNKPRTLGSLCRCSCHQVGQNAAFQHFASKFACRCFVNEPHAHRYRGALADFIFENAQSLVKRRHQKIGHSIANRLPLRRAVPCDSQRSGAGDAGRRDQCATLAIKFPGIEQLAPQRWFGTLPTCGSYR